MKLAILLVRSIIAVELLRPAGRGIERDSRFGLMESPTDRASTARLWHDADAVAGLAEAGGPSIHRGQASPDLAIVANPWTTAGVSAPGYNDGAE